MDKLDNQRAHARMLGFVRTSESGYEIYRKDDFQIQLTSGRWHVYVYSSELLQDLNDKTVRELNEWGQVKHS